MSRIPMEHDPLRRSGDALMTFIEGGQLGENGIIRVGHGRDEGLVESFAVWNGGGRLRDGSDAKAGV